MNYVHAVITSLVIIPFATFAATPELPGTTPLTVERPLDEVMIEGLHRCCLRELVAARETRAAGWKRDFTSAQAYSASIADNRDRFQNLIGVVDLRVTADPSRQHRFRLMSSLEQSSIIARTSQVTVHAVRWPVLDGVTAEGLLLMPKKIRAGVVALPDADWTPEMFCGVAEGLPESVQFVRQLAAAGSLVVIPTLISRSDEFSGHPHVGYTNQPHREFIYRQAFEVGRHIIGYEVQKVLAAIDLIEMHAQRQRPEAARTPFPIGVAGIGEGGLLALYSAALDERIQATLICGYFQEREDVWREPIYRNVWGLLTEFGDAELAGLIAPRRLVIETCRAVEITGPPAVRNGRSDSAAPGRIAHNRLASVQVEFTRAAAIYRPLKKEQELILAVSGDEGNGDAGSMPALRAFAAGLGIEAELDEPAGDWQRDVSTPIAPQPVLSDAALREKRQFDELQVHVQSVLRQSHQIRNSTWLPNPVSVEEWQRRRIPLRNWVHDELIGRLSQPRLPVQARSRLVLEADTYVGYEVAFDVVEDVIAAGILLLPKDLTDGEKRPLVVCQHGLEGTAMDTISRDPRPFSFYKAFSEELVRRGFLVYAPQNPYRGGDRFRLIQRLSNPLKRSLFTYIIAQHEQTLDWLATLPNVDADRIGFYGLSYGGKTAMRVPPLIDRYSLSICSGDFTDWVRTVATNEERFGYLFTREYEIPEWNMAHVASYAELAMLMAPRPFMIEAGHRDGGQPSEWVAGEFGKVRRHFDQLKITNRSEIEFFDGPHTIYGQRTFRFLHRHHNWSEDRQRNEKP